MPEPGSALPTLGILAGGGRLPLELAEACAAMNRPCFVLAFEGADTAPLAAFPHATVRIGAVGEALAHLKGAGVQEIVMAGNIKRPSFLSLRPDATGAKLLARLGGAMFSGDDALLKALIAFLEEEGFRIVGADDVLGGLVVSSGVQGKIRPDARAEADIAHGLTVAHALGALDIGQAVVVENGYVLGVEAAEGTDALIARCAGLRREPRGGVLVKAKKPEQEARADLPAIGPDTVEKAHAAGLAGIAVESGGAMILDRERTIARADELGLFIAGVA